MKCPYHKKCSGCQLQNLEYPRQLQMKQVRLIRLLGRFCHVDEIIGMDDPLHYRNKLQTAYASKNGKFVGGIYQSAKKSVTPVEDCMIEDRLSSEISATITRLLAKLKVKPANFENGSGFIRHTLIRRGFSTGEIMVVVVTRSGKIGWGEEFTKSLLRAHPEITTIVRNVNDSPLRISMGKKNEILFGKGYIEDRLLGLTFRISPAAFYQVNPVQTEVLYGTAKKFAALTGKETVMDAYSGTGTIGMIMADCAERVISVEMNADAVADARENAGLNGIGNIEIHEGDAGRFMQSMARRREKIDVLITDPPRSGCSREFLESTVALAPERIVYVSCNPETLARDLGYLTRKGYTVKKIQGVDMFPFTEHVETVCLLSRKQ